MTESFGASGFAAALAPSSTMLSSSTSQPPLRSTLTDTWSRSISVSAATPLRASAVDLETGEVLEGTKDEDLEVALQASVEVAGGAAPVPTSVLAEGTNLPRSSGVVSEDGAAPSLLLDELEGDLDDPAYVERRRALFHVCREQGHHPKDSAKEWLRAMYGYSSTSEIHKDQLEDICARLRDPMPL